MGADEDRAPEEVAAGDGEEASAGGKKGRYRRDKPWVSPTAVAHRRRIFVLTPVSYTHLRAHET